MKKLGYWYENNDGELRQLTLKSGAPEWVNHDCPDLYDDDDNLILHSNMDGLVYQRDDLEEFGRVMRFVKSSDMAFEKKYPQCANDLGLVRNFVEANAGLVARSIA